MILLNKIYTAIFIFVLFANSLFGQDNARRDSTEDSITENHRQNTVPTLMTHRLNYSMEVGAGFVSGSSLFSGTYTNIAPSINYLVSPKFKIEVGGIFVKSNSNFSQNSILKQNSNLSLNANQYFVYSQGQYAISNKLMLTGSVYTTLNSNKTPQINPYFLDYKGMNLGLNYKLTEHMSIGAEFRMSNGYNDYMFDQSGIGSFRQFGENKFGW